MSDWLEAEQRAERAQQLCESQRFEEAIAELDAALSINPDNATWHAQRGLLLEELDCTADAVEAYERALELDPGDVEVALSLGGALVRLGHLARALVIIDDLAGQYPDLEPVYCARIQIYTELGRHDKAEEMFYLAQQLNDSCPDCFYHIGISLAARGQTDRAIFCWQRVLDLEPDYAGVNQRIAQAFRDRKDFARAKEYLLLEVRADPGDTELLFELADLAREAGQISDAATRLAQIIELDPNYVDALAALGKLRLDLGTPAEAIHCFEAAVSAAKGAPRVRDFNLHFGLAFFRVGKWADARIQFLKAAKRKPRDQRVAMLLGECALAQDRPEEAIEWYQRILSRNARNPFAHYQLGVCRIRRGRYAAGLENCLTALSIRPDWEAAAHHAALAYVHLEQWGQARAMVRRALRRHPNSQPLVRLGRRIWRFQLARHLWAIPRALGIRCRWRGPEIPQPEPRDAQV